MHKSVRNGAMRRKGVAMFGCYEVFPDGKRYLLFKDEDLFTVVCWSRNEESEATQAIRTGKSWTEVHKIPE